MERIDSALKNDTLIFTLNFSAEWEKLFKRKNYRKQLRLYAMNGNLRSSRFRSVCWKVCNKQLI